jgi:hypothetical protein
MTALGKTLTVFVFLLSLAWSWLTVNAYVTRANWQTQANAHKAHADTAVKRAQDLEKAYKDLLGNTEAQLEKYVKAIDDQKAKIATLEVAQNKLNASFEQLNLDNKKAGDNYAILEKNLEATNKQLDAMKESRDAIETKFVGAQRSEQDARNNALASKLEADAFKQRNEQLELQVLGLLGQLNDVRLGRQGLGAAQLVPVPADLRASVVAVNADLVTISLGADAGVLKGQKLDISRLNPGKYLGYILIGDVEPKKAVGVFVPATPGRATGDNLPRLGDSVGVVR